MTKNLLDRSPVKYAKGITSHTLVGSHGDFPRKGGNCFDVVTTDGEGYNILNFKYENLKELIKRGEVSFPMKIICIAERSALLADPRIPKDWYMDRMCGVCTPKELLPPLQRLNELIDIDLGRREEKETTMDFGDGTGEPMIIVSQKMGIDETPVEIAKWRVAFEKKMQEDIERLGNQKKT